MKRQERETLHMLGEVLKVASAEFNTELLNLTMEVDMFQTWGDYADELEDTNPTIVDVVDHALKDNTRLLKVQVQRWYDRYLPAKMAKKGSSTGGRHLRKADAVLTVHPTLALVK